MKKIKSMFDYPGNLHRPYPTQIRIEATQGCTRNCSFCGITTVGNKIKKMTKETMDLIVEKFPAETKRVDFALHGEPIINENIGYIIKKLRNKVPKLQISILSNTDIITYMNKSVDFLVHLFNCGLNFYHADIYDKKTGIEFLALLKENKKILKENNIRAVNFYAIDYNVWSYHGGKNKEIILCDEHNFKTRENKATRRVHNWGGNITEEKQKEMNIPFKTIMSKCAEPFKSLVISYSGDIFLCCVDFSKSATLSNIKDISNIKDFWNSSIFQKIRHVLNQGRRDLIPVCSICSKKSFRQGLYMYAGKKYEIKELTNMFSADKLTENQKNIRSLYGY